MTNYIQHPGRIVGIKEGVAEVLMEQRSACASCHAKGACSLHEMEEKIVEVKLPDNSFGMGDDVLIIEKTSSGLKAVFFSYVLPLICMLFTLLLFVLMNKSDIFAGVAAITVLVLYYIIFSFFRKKLKSMFTFSMRKLQEDDNMSCVRD